MSYITNGGLVDVNHTFQILRIKWNSTVLKHLYALLSFYVKYINSWKRDVEREK